MTLSDPPAADADLPTWASWCAAIGRATGAFKVFPCVPGEKRPLWNNWQTDASNDPDQVDANWLAMPTANIGLAIQPGFVVIDADLYKPGKEEALDAYEKAHGELPATLEFRSARGGLHLIYSTSQNFGNSVGTLPDFGEVRGAGGLIVGPGSRFADRRYGVEALSPPVSLPAHVADRLVERKGQRASGTRELPPNVTLDDPRNVERYIEWLEKDARPSIEGQGGNNILAQTGAMGSSYALSWDTTLQAMLEHWNQRCEPPWEDAELDKHGGSGYRSAEHYGNMATRAYTFPVGAPDEPREGWGERLWSTDELLARAVPPREWALGNDADGWMPLNDVTLLYGPGGAGKTALVSQMAIAFRRGTPLFGTIACRAMPVLYVGCEDDMHELHRRLVAQGVKPGDDIKLASLIGHDTTLHPPFVHGAIADNADHTPFYQFLEFHLRAMGDVEKMLFLDNLGQMYAGDDLNKVQVRAFMNRYARSLAVNHRATVCLMAHPSEAQVQSGEGGGGSPAWSASVRSHLYFDWVRDGKNGKTGRPVGEIRVFSRKKSNYSRRHHDGEGVFLTRNADWTFTVAEKPKAPETPAAKRKREDATVESASQFIVHQSAKAVLESRPRERFGSASALAPHVAHYMAERGNKMAVDTVRKHLKRIQPGFIHWHDGDWVCTNATRGRDD